MIYQRIMVKVWDDEKFQRLTPLQQRLFLYILTNKHSNLIGAYVLKPGYVCADLGCTTREFISDLSEITKAGMVLYDPENSLLVLPRYLKHNPLTNPNQAKAGISIIKNLPKSQILERLKTTISDAPETDRFTKQLADGFPEGLPEGLPNPFPNPLPNPDTNAYSEPDSNDNSDTNSRRKLEVPYEEIIGYLNEKTGKSYRANTKTTIDVIRARWKEGYRIEDFRKVVDNQSAKWMGDPKMEQYLRPITIFGTKFENYLNSPPSQSRMGIISEKGSKSAEVARRWINDRGEVVENVGPFKADFRTGFDPCSGGLVPRDIGNEVGSILSSTKRTDR